MPTYRKPEAICDVDPGVENLTSPEQVALFVDSQKKRIEQKIAALGLRLRFATRDDIDAIQELHRKFFPAGTSLENPYALFRIVTYGCAPMIETAEGRLVACNISESYDDPERTTWGIRTAVDPSVSRHNLGAELGTYACVTGMARGARMRHAFVAPTNLSSAANVLNYVGFTVEDFDLNIPGHGPRFVLTMQLTPAGIRNNRIDLDKTRAFLDSHQDGRDFAVVACTDEEGLTRMYRHTPFRIVAFLKAGFHSQEPCFLALPESRLRVPQ